MKKLGIYIHIPFCRRKCNYCGFYSKPVDFSDSADDEKAACIGTGNGENLCAGTGNRKNLYAGTDDEKVPKARGLVNACVQAPETSYVQRLVATIRERGAKYDGNRIVDSIFVGGGTPSIISSESVSAIIGAVKENFVVTADAEITMEANPDSLTGEKLEVYRNCGVNRLSMGIQSFNDEMLTLLGRCHTRADALKSFELARAAGFDNINVDIMFAVPGQNRRDWEKTLEEAVAIEPEHISFYSLQIEEGTPFYKDYSDGRLDFVTEETDREMYHDALRVFERAGYEHYEISNAAKPGFKCRHNLKYWSFDDYLGIGAGAASFVDGVRFSERPDGGYEEYHVNDFEDNTGEFMFTGLRKVGGISKAEFRERFGRDIWEVYGERRKYLADFFERGQLREDADVLKITERGFDVSNGIMAVFV